LHTVSGVGLDLSYNKEGRGQSGQAIKLFQAPRKISFTFHFWLICTLHFYLCV